MCWHCRAVGGSTPEGSREWLEDVCLGSETAVHLLGSCLPKVTPKILKQRTNERELGNTNRAHLLWSCYLRLQQCKEPEHWGILKKSRSVAAFLPTQEAWAINKRNYTWKEIGCPQEYWELVGSLKYLECPNTGHNLCRNIQFCREVSVLGACDRLEAAFSIKKAICTPEWCISKRLRVLTCWWSQDRHRRAERSPRSPSPYNLSELSRGNKQRRKNFEAHVHSSSHTITLAFLNMTGSFLSTKNPKGILNTIKKAPVSFADPDWKADISSNFLSCFLSALKRDNSQKAKS